MTKIKFYVCNELKIYKNKPKKIFQTGKRARGAPVLDPPLLTIRFPQVDTKMPSIIQQKDGKHL